ncbi:hypothetical protein TIFTF001_027102 [Ficus carica]|uniref:CHCH domain-containing protein n=1 Tax=Ficus carica TaxID=3494 RepID=A0AA88IXY1_FICCA|nr:hypothetical protein TIFTF001_027102 [Ficus carica]
MASSATSTPPYPSAARIADSPCFPQYTASLKCLEANTDKSKCQEHFDIYKECKKKEGLLNCMPCALLFFCCNRGRLDLNATGIGLSSHETSFATYAH